MVSGSTLAVGFVLVLIGFAIVLGVIYLPTSLAPAIYLRSYHFTVGNGEQNFVTSAPIHWPYTVSGSEVFVTFSFNVSPVTPNNPALPLLVTLPSSASKLSSLVTHSSRALPTGETAIRAVLYGTNTVAMVYEPSGQYIIGADLNASWTFIFTVAYTSS